MAADLVFSKDLYNKTMKKVLFFLLLLCSQVSVAQLIYEPANEPDPIVVLKHIRHVYVDGKMAYPTLTLEEVLANPPVIKNCRSCHLVSYSFSFYVNESMEIHGPVTVKGSEYNEQVKELLKTKAYGLGTIYIDEVRGKTPDGQTRSLSGLQINFR